MIAVAKLEEDGRVLTSNPVSRQLVDVEILYLLKTGDMSGYELRKRLQKSFFINVSYGTLYPHLRSLERSRLIAGSWEQKDANAAMRKRVYALTPNGKRALISSVKRLAEIGLTMQFTLSDVNLNEQADAPSEQTTSTISLVAGFFSSIGYKVGKMVKVKGYSGAERNVDLIATKSEPKPERLIVNVVRDDLTLDLVMKFWALATDVAATKSLIVTLGKVREEAVRLASFYGIIICDGPEWFQSALDFESRFNKQAALNSSGFTF
ncbi:MAG: helix-turn-helix transcriptional regulator [Nitrososphaerota archaeon]|nr:helix-turn-helix transcriptional regulator [Nitrososphaerota archaeon]